MEQICHRPFAVHDALSNSINVLNQELFDIEFLENESESTFCTCMHRKMSMCIKYYQIMLDLIHLILEYFNLLNRVLCSAKNLLYQFPLFKNTLKNVIKLFSNQFNKSVQS